MPINQPKVSENDLITDFIKQVRFDIIQDGSVAQDGSDWNTYAAGLAELKQLIEDIGFKEGNTKLRLISGAVQNMAGTWTVLNDSGHVPFNVDTVVTDGGERLKISYPNSGGGKVTSFLTGLDDGYAGRGYYCGASSGVDDSIVKIFKRDIKDYVNWTGSAWNTFTDQVTSVTYDNTTGYIEFNHANVEGLDSTAFKVQQRVRKSGSTLSTSNLYQFLSEGQGLTQTRGFIADMDGVPVTTETTDMEFYFSREGAVEVFADPADPNNSVLANAGIWFIGIMEMP
tara:strand:- start:283 stop:1134 length:852 start_codon:yes stop_codon:yes gene_type:complete